MVPITDDKLQIKKQKFDNLDYSYIQTVAGNSE